MTVIEKNKIEIENNLQFESKEEAKLFYEMFTALIQGRRGFRSIRTINQFDVRFCLAAMCMLSWPGKTSAYKKSMEELKSVYYNNPTVRPLIRSALSKGTTSRFKRIYSSETPFFKSIKDLIA